MMKKTAPLTTAYLLIGVVTALRLAFLALSPITLFADEAQYWVWAKYLDFGYYSKPPMVAWLIAATTSLCGDTPFCVRLGAPLVNAATAVLIGLSAARLFGVRAGAWAGVCYVLLPGVTVASFMVSTDTPLLFFWALALYTFLRARESGTWRWWLGCGVAVGLGFLSKYTMAFFLIGLLGYLWRAGLKPQEGRKLAGLLVAALLAYAPNIAWNASNGFVSYAHLLENARFKSVVPGEAEALKAPPRKSVELSHCTRTVPVEPEVEEIAPLVSFHPVEPQVHGEAPRASYHIKWNVSPRMLLRKAEFFFAQFGVFGPLLFATLLFVLFRKRREMGQPLLWWIIVPQFAVMIALSFFTRALANWMAPVYVAGCILVAAYLCAGRRQWVLWATLALHGLVMVFYNAYDHMPIRLPERMDPFARMRSWPVAAKDIRAQIQAHPGVELLADERKNTAMLSYLLREQDGTPAPVYKWNLKRGAGDYFDMARGIQGRQGHDFLLVTISGTGSACDIGAYFDAARALEETEVRFTSRKSLKLAVDYMQGFQGY